MRIALKFLAVLCPAIGLAVFGSFKVMGMLESQWMRGDLSIRSVLIYENVRNSLVRNISNNKSEEINKLLNSMSKEEALAGAMICTPSGSVLAKSEGVPSERPCSQASKSVQEKGGILFRTGALTLHQTVFPISTEGKLIGYLIVLHDTKYMTQWHETTRKYMAILLIGLSFFFLLLTLLVYRWTKTDFAHRLKRMFRGLLSDEGKVDESIIRTEFSPLAKDLSEVVRKLRQAKDLVKEAETDLAWTPARLRGEVQKLFGNTQLCVVANREPYVHNHKDSQIEILRPASGLVTAVEPIVRACSGLWIAHGSGTADRETADSSGKLSVPPGKPEYQIKRVWLSKEEEEGFYYGFSNEGLWPLCHLAHTRPNFDSDDFQTYREVNEKFAHAFLEEHKESNPIALIQDYHFTLLPQMIRAEKPDAILSLFWHIPWPNPEAFGICPWKKELLRGMLGADLIGFHTQFHCNNFLDTVDRFLEARVDREQFSVTIQGHVCYAKPFSISVEWPSRYDIPVEAFAKEREELLAELNLPMDIKIGIGVDRIDYTKGIVERLRSVEKLLDKHPELVGKFVFIQIGAPSRTHIKAYKDLNLEVQEIADHVNKKFSKAEVPPILLKLTHHDAPDIYRYYRAADLCFVSSLHDGMNLVAKEYVSAHSDMSGALVLSTFAGASRELTEAMIVNPYDIEECAAALFHALTMPEAERRRRMERMIATVSEKNVYAWAGSFLSEIHRIAQAKSDAASAQGQDLANFTVSPLQNNFPGSRHEEK
ncbi:MAG: trehalose-6-phosphate synthase [Bdellovibrionia bacterium]